MIQPVATTLQRIFARQASTAARPERRKAARSRSDRQHRADFAETRPVVFRSEAFAEDLVLSHGAV